MFSLQRLFRPVSRVLIILMIWAGVWAYPAQAALVGTDSVIVQSSAEDSRARLHGLLQRDDVRAQMEAYGIDPAEAQSRVDSLSDAEVAAIAGKLDQLPAGGNVGAVIGAILLIFFVLLLTDLLGLTDVFPFVRR
jgi:hypothetical protein